MSKKASGVFENLRLVYSSYGGLNALVRSEYFWVALIVTTLCSRFALEYSWASYTLSIMPSLAGFSVAAFAIYFSVIDPEMQKALKKPSIDLNNRSPLLVIASSVVHAVFVQIIAMLYAFVFLAKPAQLFLEIIPTTMKASIPSILITWLPVFSSFLGLFLSIYGMILVVAATLSMFRVVDIKSKI